MTGLPTILVELDDGTGTFPYNITADVRLEGSGYSLNRGREDTQAAVTAGSLTMTLKNHDGKYSFNSTVLVSPSPIVVDQKIRIKETINATTFTRFTGYVKSWPTAWPGAVDTFSLVNLTASDAQARGERKPLRSLLEEEFLSTGPAAYYAFAEPEGSSTAADTSGNQHQMLVIAGTGAAPTFGTGDGVQFTGGQYLVGQQAEPTIAGIAVALKRPADGTGLSEIVLATKGADLLAGVPSIRVSNSAITVNTGNYSTTQLTTAFSDDSVHMVELVESPPGTMTLWLDAAVLHSGAGSIGFAGTTLSVGGPGQTVGNVYTGKMSNLALLAVAPTSGEITERFGALTGFDGESGTDRITRLAGYASIPVGTLDPSLTNVPTTDTSGAFAWPAIQDTVDAEGGLAYINGSGDLIFFNRHDAPGKTAPDITLSAAFVRPDAQPTGDDESLKNYFAATAQGTGVEQVVRDEASELAHGQYPDSKTYLVQTDAEALDRANWIVGNYAEPTTRWPSMTLLLHKMTAAQAAAALAIEPGTWLRVTDFPSQTPDDTTVDVMVEGIAETCSADEWTLTLNVVARGLFQAWILGDSTYGVLGSTTRLGV